MYNISKKTYLKMKQFIKQYEQLQTSVNNNQPYIKEVSIEIDSKYNPKYGDDRKCICGHSYYRHFDSYEEMENVGCKYCSCNEFVEKI